ncbi:MAG: saccharopine dehydrogenase NADP-binding domain-containing protein [Gammaproteobacteria bacterium]|nr:saccharopine dehydrogenase NADP-binding domain-containing protein [Gammaproteobacteria bacterium]
MPAWLIYGANGYTGRLMAAEAVRRGLQPILAGRNAEALQALGVQHSLPVRVFDLADPVAVAAGLQGISLVLHCAGPFSATSAPMLEGCLAAGTHYLDITGEIEVFAHCHAQAARARARGIVVLPGAGFDVVPTDCVAGLLKRELPDTTELVLGFEAAGGASPGTAKTGVEGLAKGGRVRSNGQLVRVPLAYKTRAFSYDGKSRSAMTIPWGDLYTAYVSTGIANIETYLVVSPKGIATARRANWIRPLLGLRPVMRFLQRRIETSVQGPSDEKRARTRSRIWGEARNARGEERRVEIDTPNGYDLTVTGALGIVEHLMRTPVPGGYYTPAMLMGPDYVLTLPGVQRVAA